jgi:hypothetical protein
LQYELLDKLIGGSRADNPESALISSGFKYRFSQKLSKDYWNSRKNRDD